jgi:hypothetical protein
LSHIFFGFIGFIGFTCCSVKRVVHRSRGRRFFGRRVG